MKKRILAVCISGLFSVPVLADGFYVSGDVGRSKWSLDPTSRNVSTYYIGAGYSFDLVFNDKVALELGYRNFGSINEWDESTSYRYKTDASATQFSVIASHTFNTNMSFYGRLGYADMQIDSKIDKGVTASSVSGSTNKVFGGIGASYLFNNNVGVRLEYDRYAKLNEIKISTLMLGVDYHFNAL